MALKMQSIFRQNQLINHYYGEIMLVVFYMPYFFSREITQELLTPFVTLKVLTSGYSCSEAMANWMTTMEVIL
jgi:hypothetical protein